MGFDTAIDVGDIGGNTSEDANMFGLLAGIDHAVGNSDGKPGLLGYNCVLALLGKVSHKFSFLRDKGGVVFGTVILGELEE